MISNEQLEAIAQQVEQQGLGENVVSGLRSTFSDIHFTYCSEDDIHAGKPVLEREAFNIYLVDGREHCLCLTNDADIASGVVLAEIYDD